MCVRSGMPVPSSHYNNLLLYNTALPYKSCFWHLMEARGSYLLYIVFILWQDKVVDSMQAIYDNSLGAVYKE